MDIFDQADVFVAGTEAGYVNNPADPGGETKYGISKRAHPDVDIAALTIEAAREIRRREYWDRIGGDGLPAPLALLAYDAAVNNGVSRALQWLDLARRHGGDGAEICAEFTSLRLCFMAALPTWKIFGHGWSRRLCRLPYQAVQMGDA